MTRDELRNMFWHNATVNYPTIKSDYEQDLFDQWFETAVMFAFDDLRHEFKDLGKIYQYGRSGRTVLPAKMMTRYGSLDGIDYDSNFLRENFERLIEFNNYVKAWCRSVAENWKEAREEYIDDIKKNAGKKRRIRTVTEYI